MKDEVIEDYCDEVPGEGGKPVLVLQEEFNPFADNGELDLMESDDYYNVIIFIINFFFSYLFS